MTTYAATLPWARGLLPALATMLTVAACAGKPQAAAPARLERSTTVAVAAGAEECANGCAVVVSNNTTAALWVGLGGDSTVLGVVGPGQSRVVFPYPRRVGGVFVGTEGWHGHQLVRCRNASRRGADTLRVNCAWSGR